MAVLAVSTDNFAQEVLQSDVPVLVDFWASWCGPCKMLSPVVAEISEETEGIKVCSINVDDNPELTMQYKISSIPALVLFKDGKEERRSVGFIPKDRLLAFLA